jgi:hypothetical protein
MSITPLEQLQSEMKLLISELLIEFEQQKALGRSTSVLQYISGKVHGLIEAENMIRNYLQEWQPKQQESK